MGRTSAFVILAFLAGLAIGLFARSARLGALARRDMHSGDLAAIAKLHQADVEATLRQDPVYLDQLWSDDCVKLDVPGPPIVGIKAIKEMYAKFKADYPEFKVLKYTNDMTDVQIADGWRLKWAIRKPRMLAASLRLSVKNTISPSSGLLVVRGSGSARLGAVHWDMNSVVVYSLLFLSCLFGGAT